MAKPNTYYVCSNCGKRSTAYMGRCPQCHEFGTMEQVTEQRETGAAARNVAPSGTRTTPQRLREVETGPESRMAVPVEEFSRVMGGGIVPGSITLIAGDPGIGKCLVGSTRVLNPLTGAYLPITHWAQEKMPVLSIDDQTFQLKPGQATHFFERGLQDVVEVRTQLGRTLRCTPTHPVLTPDGWKPVRELAAGSYIAAPRSLSYFGQDVMPDAEVKLIGYILSDGSAQSSICVTSAIPEVASDLATIATAFGMQLHCYDKKGTLAKQFRFVNDVQQRAQHRSDFATALNQAKRQAGISWAEWSRRANVDYALLRVWHKGETVPDADAFERLVAAVGISPDELASTARSAAELTTPIARFLEKMGLRYSKAANKTVPECIFRLPREQMALFLKTLFTCDGSVYVSNAENAGISYSTISRRLAEDVQHLLLRFGFVVTLRHKPMQVNGTPYSAYELVLLGTSQVQRFLAEIGIMGRESACEQIRAMNAATASSTRRDLIPLTPYFWDHLHKLKGEMSFKTLSSKSDVRIFDRRHERPLCRSTIQKLATYFADPYLATLGDSDVYWDQIQSITPAGCEAVYDISVAEHPNFVANDLIVHNSTLLLQLAAIIADTVGKVLYVSGEESTRQIKMRAERLSIQSDELFLVTETSLEAILEHAQAVNPKILIVDSIQTTFSDDKPSSAGTVTQVRECAARLQMLAKSTGIGVFLVGHVTKEGTIAGPRVLEHIVDTVLYLEGDSFHAYRLLRSVKNRFGATNEVGVFEMRGSGLAEVTNPSEVFLAERVVNASGSSILVTMEGTRPLLVEVQALASATSYPNPRRTANGVDFNRLQLLTAVLTRRVGLRLSEQDVFVNVIGGMTVDEPAADLAIAVSIASSVWDVPVPADLAIVGEVGLSGELRAVSQLPSRLKEAAKLGFKRVIVPKTTRPGDPLPGGIQVIAVRSLMDALNIAMPKEREKK